MIKRRFINYSMCRYALLNVEEKYTDIIFLVLHLLLCKVKNN